MTAKIIKMEKEKFPEVRLVGRRYTDNDRVNGSFGAKWGEWFANGLFKPIEAIGNAVSENGDSYIGAMRVVNGVFEYWIGMFLAADSPVPDGYEYVDIAPLDYAVFWLYGDEKNGELYGIENHNMCLEEICRQGWKMTEDCWCFERYNCPRFTTPDEKGNVILDYGIAIDT